MRFTVTYHVRSDATSIEARAKGIAVEQSVEMPLEAIDDVTVLADIVGQVEGIDDLGDGRFAVRIAMASSTIGHDAGQFLNMLFGNTSLHEDVWLADVTIPDTIIATFGGPRHGIGALRQRLHLHERAFTGSALKPQGLAPDQLALLAERFARGGLDFIKDDHGLADQRYSPFAEPGPRLCGRRGPGRARDGASDALHPQPDRKSRRDAATGADRAGRRAGLRHGRADDRRLPHGSGPGP